MPPATPPTRTGNGLGVAALIIGILALITAILPFLSFVAWVPAIIAIGLGIAGLVQKGKPKATAAIGLIAGVLAIIIGLVVSLVGIVTVAGSVSESVATNEAIANEEVTLTFEASSSLGTVDSIDYSTTIDGIDVGKEEAGAASPWKFEQQVKRGEQFDFNYYTLTVGGGSADAVVTCKITLDGVVIADEQATGPYSYAFCSGSSMDLPD